MTTPTVQIPLVVACRLLARAKIDLLVVQARHAEVAAKPGVHRFVAECELEWAKANHTALDEGIKSASRIDQVEGGPTA